MSTTVDSRGGSLPISYNGEIGPISSSKLSSIIDSSIEDHNSKSTLGEIVPERGSVHMTSNLSAHHAQILTGLDEYTKSLKANIAGLASHFESTSELRDQAKSVSRGDKAGSRDAMMKLANSTNEIIFKEQAISIAVSNMSKLIQPESSPGLNETVVFETSDSASSLEAAQEKMEKMFDFLDAVQNLTNSEVLNNVGGVGGLGSGAISAYLLTVKASEATDLLSEMQGIKNMLVMVKANHPVEEERIFKLETGLEELKTKYEGTKKEAINAAIDTFVKTGNGVLGVLMTPGVAAAFLPPVVDLAITGAALGVSMKSITEGKAKEKELFQDLFNLDITSGRASVYEKKESIEKEISDVQKQIKKDVFNAILHTGFLGVCVVKVIFPVVYGLTFILASVALLANTAFKNRENIQEGVESGLGLAKDKASNAVTNLALKLSGTALIAGHISQNQYHEDRAMSSLETGLRSVISQIDKRIDDEATSSSGRANHDNEFCLKLKAKKTELESVLKAFLEPTDDQPIDVDVD